MTIATSHPCSACNQPAPIGRNLCWSCTARKKRYGMTSPELLEALKDADMACVVCHAKRRANTSLNLCSRCYTAYRVLQVPAYRILLLELLVSTEKGMKQLL